MLHPRYEEDNKLHRSSHVQTSPCGLSLDLYTICTYNELYGPLHILDLTKLFDLLHDRKQIVCREDGKQKVNILKSI